MEKTILVVDDEASIRELLEFNLTKEGYRVLLAENGGQALDKLSSGGVDLILLDLMLPGVDGLEVCRRIRRLSQVPVIMLTARDSELDKILGLELGADDYVTKPFSPRELVSRVRAVLRRSDVSTQRGNSTSIHDGELEIYEDKYEAYVSGERVSLTPKEFELLAMLARSPGKVFTRDFLLDRIWGYDFAGDTRTVDVHIRRLRKKLGDDSADRRRIVTVHGVGYKFEPRKGS